MRSVTIDTAMKGHAATGRAAWRSLVGGGVTRMVVLLAGPAMVLIAGCAGDGSSPGREPGASAQRNEVIQGTMGDQQASASGTPGANTQGDPMTSGDPGVELFETPSGKKLPGLSTIKYPSGVVATDLVFGTGATAMPNSVIKVHYHGTLPNGRVFDTTRGNPPVKFPLNQLIPGWREGIPGMTVGGVRRLVVPAKEAYGDEGAPPDIPPKTDLIFTIELVEVVEKK